MFSFDAKYLLPLSLFVAKNDIRYYLEGYGVLPSPRGGALIVATNGHVIAVAHDPNGYCIRSCANAGGCRRHGMFRAAGSRTQIHAHRSAGRASGIGDGGIMKHDNNETAFASLVASLIDIARDGGTIDAGDAQDWLRDAGILQDEIITQLPCSDGEECKCMDVADSLVIGEDTCLRITDRGRLAQGLTRRSHITEKQMHILRHSLGLDENGQGTPYRNHFVTGAGSKDYPDCTALVEAKMMTRKPGSELTGGGDLFLVTPAGREVAKHNYAANTQTSAAEKAPVQMEEAQTPGGTVYYQATVPLPGCELPPEMIEKIGSSARKANQLAKTQCRPMRDAVDRIKSSGKQDGDALAAFERLLPMDDLTAPYGLPPNVDVDAWNRDREIVRRHLTASGVPDHQLRNRIKEIADFYRVRGYVTAEKLVEKLEAALASAPSDSGVPYVPEEDAAHDKGKAEGIRAGWNAGYAQGHNDANRDHGHAQLYNPPNEDILQAAESMRRAALTSAPAVSDGWDEITLLSRQVIEAHNTNPFINLTKTAEEVGELAGAIIANLSRESQIDEVADIVICAIGHGAFIDLQPVELADAVRRKSAKGVAVGKAGGKAAYLAATPTDGSE